MALLRRLVALCGAALLLGLSVAGGAAADTVDRTRALVAYAALEHAFANRPAGTYREELGASVGSRAWPLSQALAAAIGVARLPGAGPAAARDVRVGLGLLEGLRTGALYRASPGGDVYYDDNEWLAQDILDWAGRSGSAGQRQVAAIFAGITSAWDDDPASPCPGGVRWTTAPGNDDRNTVTTATGALVGLRLYALTRRPGYLVWSQRMLAWVDHCLLAPNGLAWDHLDAAGEVDRTEWSYNQGSLLAAYLRLYQANGSPAALARAERIADATLASFDGRWLTDEPPEFAAIFFRDLLALAAVDGRPAYVAEAEAYGDQAWNELRDPATGLFSFGRRPCLLDQAAVVQLYAALAASPIRVAS